MKLAIGWAPDYLQPRGYWDIVSNNNPADGVT